MSWKRLNRRTLIDSKFLKVYEDKVELPNGHIIEDFTLVKKPDYIMIVALDQEQQLIAIDEYKYALDQTIHTLPAGHIERDENPLDAAKRELLEETGYKGGEWEYLGVFYDYPSKDIHQVHFVKATNVLKTQDQQLELSENIKLRVIPYQKLKEEIAHKEWKANATLAAFVAAGLLS